MKVIEVNKENFEKEVIQSDKRVLVDFNANWCGPCRMLRPLIDAIAESNDDVKFVSINIDNEDELSVQYNVSSIPCLIVFDKGKEIKRSIGLISEADIETLIGD